MIVSFIPFTLLIIQALFSTTVESAPLEKRTLKLPSNYGSYAPQYETCPASKNLVRSADIGLSQMEKEWLQKRHAKTDLALRDFLKYTAKFSDEDIEKSLPANHSINIGIAPSGGSWRAFTVGAGAIAALDNRTRGAFEHGLGGLYQATTYLSGLSGGGWLVGSWSMNGYPSIDEILEKRQIWNLNHPFFSLFGLDFVKSIHEWRIIIAEVKQKAKAGFKTSVVDYYNRALARQLFSKDDNYFINRTFSSLRDSGPFSSGDAPLPIMLANGKQKDNQVYTYKNSTVYEMSPFEFGSWDKSTRAFTDMKYLGTELKDGQPVSKRNDNKDCVVGYDNAGFLIGTTSTMFEVAFEFALKYTKPFKPLNKLLAHFVNPIQKKKIQVGVYNNPFYDSVHGSSRSLAETSELFLVDGGEDQMKIPLIPLVQPERQVDSIIAVDMGAEEPGFWPSGLSLVHAYERQFTEVGQGIAFPYVPNVETFKALGFLHRPVFFGCDASNLTSLSYIPPLIIYNANTPRSFASDGQTMKFKYSEKQFRGHISNGFEVVTNGNLTDDSEYATCVGCAVVRRSQERLGVEQSEQCKRCFQRYCWNGTTVA